MAFLFELFGWEPAESKKPAVEQWRVDSRREELFRKWLECFWKYNTLLRASYALNYNLNDSGKAYLASMLQEAKRGLDEVVRLQEEFKNIHG